MTYSAEIPVGEFHLEGDLDIPEAADGLVIFAHGSGSSRFSGRNRFVARELNKAGLATLLTDLLTRDEEQADQYTAQLRFDIGLLADRLLSAALWANVDPRTMNFPIGLFGASTGGGAALVAAAGKPDLIHAVVSRGGRPDLAGAALPYVRCPTLLIVGGHDEPVIEMNESAMKQMKTEASLVIVPKATHLFEEPGTLEQVARLASQFFTMHLPAPTSKIILDGLDPGPSDSARA